MNQTTAPLEYDSALPAPASAAPSRKALYETPALIAHGRLRDLTLAGGNSGDGGGTPDDGGLPGG